MAGETNSPNMNLPVPGVAVTTGPQWASDINSCLSIIDGHNHSAGSGVPINPNGLNINADLTFNSHNAINLRSARFSVQNAALSLASDIGCVYVTGVDLYYNDVNGNQIQLTANGSIAGASGNIANLSSPASATYVSGTGTFVWQSAANTAANLDAGFIILRNSGASAHGITFQAPNSLAADYTITLPSLPASQHFLTIDSSGNMGSAWTTDGSTIIVSSNALQVGNNSISRVKQTAVGQQVSSSCGQYFAGSTSFTDITNLSVTITTTGRPVMVMIMSDGSGNNSVFKTAGNLQLGQVRIVNGSTEIGRVAFGIPISSGQPTEVPGQMMILDAPAAGTYTYKAQLGATSISSNVSVEYVVLCAYEL